MSLSASNRNSTTDHIDWWTLGLMVSLTIVGLFMIYAVGFGKQGYPEDLLEFITKTTVGKQIVWVIISFIGFIFVMLVDWKLWRALSYIIFGFSLLLLLLVPFIGTEIHGQRCWFGFGSATFQPSEFGKFATALALSSYLSTYSTNLQQWRSILIAGSIVGLPILLILLQPDAGSALVFMSFNLVLFREGFTPWPFIVAFSLITLFILSFIFTASWVMFYLLLLGVLLIIMNIKYNKAYWLLGFTMLVSVGILGIIQNRFEEVLVASLVMYLVVAAIQWYANRKIARQIVLQSFFIALAAIFCFSIEFVTQRLMQPHHRVRLEVWLTPNKCDPRGALYNVLQSKMAISSGGLQGKGFLEGAMTKLNYVPEQTTDFIFCTIGEEQGFIGSFIVIGLFAALLIRMVFLAERQRNTYSRIYIYCIIGILFFHFFLNIGMTMGLVPIIGIPLPFVSKGGSSLLFFTIMMAVVLKSDSYRYSV